MNRKSIIGIGIAIPVLIVAGFALFLLGQANELPWQTQPTRIPVGTPFANVGGTAPAGTTVAASTPAASATTARDTGYGNYGNYGNVTTASSAPAATPSTSSSASAAQAPGGATIYTIAGDKSEAKVTVNEKLANLPAPSDAVLTTNAIQGQLFLGADTKPVEGAKIMVDLRTLKSDKAQRDNYIRTNTLQADQFPLAVFVVTGVDGWTGPLTEGKQMTFKLLGNMTIHGVTKPVSFDTTAMMQGGAISGTATTNFKFEDFGLTPPSLSIVKASDLIKLDLNIVANKAG
ncbi:MAG: YceI family protein [Thermomicrobiales bacterium]